MFLSFRVCIGPLINSTPYVYLHAVSWLKFCLIMFPFWMTTTYLVRWGTQGSEVLWKFMGREGEQALGLDYCGCQSFVIFWNLLALALSISILLSWCFFGHGSTDISLDMWPATSVCWLRIATGLVRTEMTDRRLVRRLKGVDYESTVLKYSLFGSLENQG